jgi:hypothetical protein
MEEERTMNKFSSCQVPTELSIRLGQKLSPFTLFALIWNKISKRRRVFPSSKTFNPQQTPYHDQSGVNEHELSLRYRYSQNYWITNNSKESIVRVFGDIWYYPIQYSIGRQVRASDESWISIHCYGSLQVTRCLSDLPLPFHTKPMLQYSRLAEPSCEGICSIWEVLLYKNYGRICWGASSLLVELDPSDRGR